jgi:hypothetical protein
MHFIYDFKMEMLELHRGYHPVQKVSDLRSGKKSCVHGGGAQFLIPFKVGPL